MVAVLQMSFKGHDKCINEALSILNRLTIPSVTTKVFTYLLAHNV